jgi:ABC-2 type transport system permease protein
MKSFFYSPIAYVVIGFFIMLTGLFFWIYNINLGDPRFPVTLSTVMLFLVFLMPVITMKLLADEKKNGTEVLLRTSPLSIKGIVLGKYFAALMVFLIMVVLTMIFPFIISFFGKISFPTLVGGYIGFFLVGASFLSIGIFTSSVTENQIVAAMSGIVILLVMYLVQTIGVTIGGMLGSILTWVSLLSRYEEFSSGIFNFASVIFYISFTVVMLFVTIANIERKRWN